MRESDRRIVAEMVRWAALAGRKPAELAKLLCVSQRKYYRLREEPGNMSLYEFRQLVKVAKTSDEEILKIIKG